MLTWEWMIDTNFSGAQQYAAWDALGEFQNINGNLTNINSEEIAFLFDSCGTYTVWLKATDDNGCDSTYSFDVVVYDLPIIDFQQKKFVKGTVHQ